MRLRILPSTVKAWSIIRQAKGFSLVEIILASAIFVFIVAALIGNIIYVQESAVVSGARARAVALAEEGLEASRNIRDASFANLTDGNHGLAISSNQWTFSGTQDVTDSVFTRQLQISTPSANRKQVISQVTWQQTPQRTGSVSLTTYLTNWLATAGIGNWSLPILEGTYNAAGNEDGFKVFVSGNYAYLVRNNGTPDFLVIDISNLAAPTLAGSLSLTGTPMSVWAVGNYAYVANRDDSQEIQVIDISNPAAPSQVFSYNASGTNDGDALFISGNYLYLARFGAAGPELVIMDISSPAVPTLTGSFDFGATDTFYDLFVYNGYAFLVSGSNTQEVAIVDVSAPATPNFVVSVNLSGNSDALSIAGFTDRLVVGRTSGEVVLLDISTPASPAVISTVATTGSVFDLDIGNSNNYVWLASSGGASEFKIIDISNQAAPTVLGTLDLAGSLNGIFYDSILDRAFGASAANAQELVIIAPS